MAEFDITDLNSRVDIVELVNAYGVRLRRSGSEYKGLCPFHDEKTASFMVDPIKGVFHCFGFMCTAQFMFNNKKQGASSQKPETRNFNPKQEVKSCQN